MMTGNNNPRHIVTADSENDLPLRANAVSTTCTMGVFWVSNWWILLAWTHPDLPRTAQ
jgi:hypothetical protein